MKTPAKPTGLALKPLANHNCDQCGGTGICVERVTEPGFIHMVVRDGAARTRDSASITQLSSGSEISGIRFGLCQCVEVVPS